MNLSKSTFLLFAAIALVFSSLSDAAVVDGAPSYDLQSDTGLYVWRQMNGTWQVRLVAGGSSQEQFSGDFEATQSISVASRISFEPGDVADLSSLNILHVQLQVSGNGLDGAAFNLASNADMCLRALDTTGVVYLGQNAVPATLPVDLTESGACTTAPAPDSGLFISRITNGDWQVRLLTNDQPENFNGVFETTQSIQWVENVSIEASDSVTLFAPDELRFEMSAWPTGSDGINFSVVNDGGVCLRDAGGSLSSVYLGSLPSDSIPVSTPADLTNSGACGGGTTPPPPTGRKFNVGHYIELMQASDSQSTMSNSIRAGVVGLVKRYTWRELESSFGQYDFSEVTADLNYLTSQGMQLIVLIEDKTFVNERPTPEYLWQNWHTRANRAGGYTAVRWAPYVVTRMKALVRALGERFDSNPNFEGIAMQESAPGFDDAALDATSYTPEKYRDALINVLSDAGGSLPTSRVFWFMNYLPRRQSYIGDVARAVAAHGIVLGGPDVLPDNLPLQTHTYPFYDQLAGQMPMFGRLSPACYAHLHEDTSYPTKYWRMGELFRYARDHLHVNYMLWTRLPSPVLSDSYDWTNALPVIRNNPVFNP